METESNTLAIFGGTFNPVHLGHLTIAESAKREIGYHRILFIPSSIPAHKDADPFTSDGARIAMIELAIRDSDYVQIDTCEIERGGISYMIDTVDYVNANYNFAGKPGLIIGDDLLAGFHKWRRVDELVEMVDLIVARRFFAVDQEFCFKHTYLKNPMIEAASRDVRSMAARDEKIDGHVPKGVAGYIVEHHLYRRA